MKGQYLLETLSNPGVGRISRNASEHCLHILSQFAPARTRTAGDASGVRCTVWGAPSHFDMQREAVPAWVIRVFLQDRLEMLDELLGPFLVLIEDVENRIVTLITDPMGLMPLFLCADRNGTLFGTDVLALAAARSGDLKIDRRSLASWLWFGFDCTSRGLVEGMTRLPGGSVTEITPGGRTVHSYSRLSKPLSGISRTEMARHVRDTVQSTTTTLLRDRPEAIVALSGGWDSRLILACAVAAGKRPLAVCVVKSEGEAAIAENVARRLGVEIDLIRPSVEAFDLYPRPYGLTHSGYPITRFVTHEISRRYPGRPLLNGFLGDSLIRGSHDRVEGQLEEEYSGSSVDLLMGSHSMAGGFHLLDSELAAHVRKLARESMEVAVEEGRTVGRIFQWVDLMLRQRFYIANNFLQHLHLSEPLLPFYCVDLIRLKLTRDPTEFDSALYRQVLRGLDPALASIPHSDDLRGSATGNTSRRVREMALYLASHPAVLARAPVSVRRSYPRLLAALAGRSEMAPYVKYLYAMYLLEAHLETSGIDLDWRAILVDKDIGV